jgi:hypothetical protein
MTLAITITLVRFDVRQDHSGWTIFDRQTDEPATMEGRETIGLAREDAEEIADLMNTLALMQNQQTVH